MRTFGYLLLLLWGVAMVAHGLTSETAGSGSYATGFAAGQLAGVALGMVLVVVGLRRLLASPS